VLTGGDAASEAAADVVLDIVFAIDTSGSMTDDIAAIGTAAQNVIRNLNCPDCDVWVRARFFGIDGGYGAVFNESLRSYINNLPLVDVNNNPIVSAINSTEDNGVAVQELANYYEWAGAGPGQDYYKAVVHIGDEGAQDGTPVNQADYDAGYAGNQAAILNGVMVFSWVTDDPYAGVPALFYAMAQGGGPLGGHTFGATGGIGITQGSGDSGAVETKLEEIICFAAGGGTGTPDAGGSVVLLGLGLAALGLIRRKN